MTCVLGMVVRREREIRYFVKTPFYRVLAPVLHCEGEHFDGEWRAVEGSRSLSSRRIFIRRTAFKEKERCRGTDSGCWSRSNPCPAAYRKGGDAKRKTKIRRLLFNLAELQNVCSRLFKISPDETLKYCTGIV